MMFEDILGMYINFFGVLMNCFNESAYLLAMLAQNLLTFVTWKTRENFVNAFLHRVCATTSLAVF